jgi:hypothetical protein
MRGGEPRDAIPLLPPLLTLAGAGAVHVWKWGKDLDLDGGRFGATLAGTLVALSVLMCLPGSLRYHLANTGQEIEHKRMGNWIQENFPRQERQIVTRKPMVAFYADGKSIGLPVGSMEDFRQRALEGKAKFFAMDSRTTGKVYPQFAHLLHPDHAPDWLEFLHREEAPDGEVMILYRILR